MSLLLRNKTFLKAGKHGQMLLEVLKRVTWMPRHTSNHALKTPSVLSASRSKMRNVNGKEFSSHKPIPKAPLSKHSKPWCRRSVDLAPTVGKVLLQIRQLGYGDTTRRRLQLQRNLITRMVCWHWERTQMVQVHPLAE